jgi:hypothetical protein
LTYSTYLGGPSLDILEDMTVDPLGYVTLVGWVTGNLDPVFATTPDALDRTWNGSQDSVLARLKLDGAGSADLKYGTLIGGSNMDNFYAVAFDPTNPEIITAVGMSWSDDFPVTLGVIDPNNPRFSELFESQAAIIARFRFSAGGAGTRLWSSYFGPDRGANILATDVTINNLGEPIVVGLMGDGNFETTRGAFDRLPEGTLNRENNFITRLSPDGTQARYSSYFGSTGNDSDQFQISPALAHVSGNSVIIASSTASALFPVTAGAYDTTFGSVLPSADGYVVQFTTEPDDSGDLEVGIPTILRPPNGAKFGFGSFMGRLRWTAVPDASGIDGYEFDLSTRPDFVNAIRGTSHRTEHIHPGSGTGESGFSLGTWYWRVRAFDRAGNIGAWSAASSFTLDAPDAQPTLKNVGTYPTSVVGGAPGVGILYLDKPAPAGGVTVELSLRYNRNVGYVSPNLPIPVTVPATVTIPEGKMNVVFDLTTSEVDATVAVDIVASINGIGTSNNLLVKPPSVVDIRELVVYPVTVTGGNPSMGTLTLKDAAPPGGVVVRLTTGHPQAASVPSSVTIPEGERTVSFPITTRPVRFDIDTVVRAHTPFDSEAKYIFVRRQTDVRLNSLTVSPRTLNGGMVSTGTISLNMAAPITTWPALDGVHVNISSSRPDIIGLSPFITIYNPDSLGTFTFFARSIPTTTSITLTAAYDNFVVTAPLVVNAGPPVTISSVTLNVSTVRGGQGGVAWANLSAPAPVGGVAIQFSTSDPDLFFSSDPVAYVSQGSSSAMLSFIAKNASASKTVNIIASYGNSSASAPVTINPSDGLSRWPTSVTVSPSTIVVGSSATGTVTINAPAPSGGTTFQLSTSPSGAAASVPPTVTIPAGATSVSFPVNSTAVSTTTTVDIWALHNFSLSARLTLTPGAAPPPLPGTPSLLSPSNDSVVAQPVTLDWSDPANAASYEIQVDDSSTFSAPLVRSLTSTASQISVTGLSNVRHWWRVRARNSAGQAGSWSSVRRFTPQTSSTTTPALSSISLSPTSVTGGGPSTGTARLSSTAPSGGLVVTLSSSSANTSVPSSVTIPAGASSANFIVATRTVTSSTSATISGALNGITRSATLTINPASSGGTLTAPSLVTPGSDARFSPGQNITFDWSDISGAASYTIQIDDSDSFSSPQIVNQNTTPSTYSTATLPTRTMWWRAHANDSSGSVGSWSAIRRFEVKD